MFKCVLGKELKYPRHYISPILEDLLRMMLAKNPNKRITKGLQSKIKKHPWCADIDWDAIQQRKLKPPHQPSVFKSNFDPEYVRDTSMMTDKRPDDLDVSTISQQRRPRFKRANLDQTVTTQHSYYYQDGQSFIDVHLSPADLSGASEPTANHMNFLNSQLAKQKPVSGKEESLFNGFSYQNPVLPHRD